MGGDAKTPAGLSAEDLEKLDARYVTYTKLLGWTGAIVAAGATLILSAIGLHHTIGHPDGDHATQRDVERVLEDVRELRQTIIGLRTALDERPSIQDSGNSTVTVGTTNPADRKPWLSLSEFANYRDVSERTVHRWLEQGKLGGKVCRRSPVNGKWEFRNPLLYPELWEEHVGQNPTMSDNVRQPSGGEESDPMDGEGKGA